VFEHLNELCFPDQPMGRSLLGTAKTLKAFNRDMLHGYLTTHYRGPDMVVSAAGAVDHRRVVDEVAKKFASFEGTPGPTPQVAMFGKGGSRVVHRDLEQAHLTLALEGVPQNDLSLYSLQVFTNTLGGGMSSRLFQEVRERRGLCYAIYSSCWALADTGLFGIHAATGPEMMGKLIDVVGEQLVGAAAEKPAEAELARAKAQLKAGLLMGLESSSARAEQMARQLLLFDRLIEPPELIERIDAVTAEAVRELAAGLVSGAPPSVSVVGAGRKGEAFARTAAERVTHA
jgi:predicted Zn-dependent peptidase